MEMNGNDLLLGNDVLKQFKKVQIDFKSTESHITLGEVHRATTTTEKDIPTEMVISERPPTKIPITIEDVPLVTTSMLNEISAEIALPEISLQPFLRASLASYIATS
jgi:hypothetical protein